MPIVPVEPSMLEWAIRRSGRDEAIFYEKHPRLTAWLEGRADPTLRQLEAFARTAYVPLGFLLLPTPPEEPQPLPDFRTVGGREVEGLSPNARDAIYLCEQRQEWFRSYSVENDFEPLRWVGSTSIEEDPVAVAARMREDLGFSVRARAVMGTWEESLRELMDLVDALGVLVMRSGVVGSNFHRGLDPQEFRGFALVDDRAPLIFLNGADSIAAQHFTLIHELAHIYDGGSALDAPSVRDEGGRRVEQWCNRVASEVLVPARALGEEFQSTLPLPEELQRLARTFKVSTLTILVRLRSTGRVGSAEFEGAYAEEEARVFQQLARRSAGGNFYNTASVRVSPRFARALIGDVHAGSTLHRDAFRLLGVRAPESFERLGEHLGVA